MPVKILPFLACRCFALYLFYEAFIALVTLWGMRTIDFFIADMSEIGFNRSTYCLVTVKVIIGIFFWFKAELLSRRVSGQYHDSAIVDFSIENIQTAAFCILGVVVASRAIAPFGGLFGSILIDISYPSAIQVKTLMMSLINGTFWLLWGLIIFFSAPWLTHVSRRYIKKDGK